MLFFPSLLSAPPLASVSPFSSHRGLSEQCRPFRGGGLPIFGRSQRDAASCSPASKIRCALLARRPHPGWAPCIFCGTHPAAISPRLRASRPHCSSRLYGMRGAHVIEALEVGNCRLMHTGSESLAPQVVLKAPQKWYSMGTIRSTSRHRRHPCCSARPSARALPSRAARLSHHP